MSCNDDIQYWRVIQKYSTISGQEPTVPPSSDHNDGTWSDTDLYIGEVFMNVADNRIWYRAVDGIHEIGATGASGSFIGDYVPTSGGTFSGIVYAPTFSSLEIVSGLITASAFAGPQIGTSASVIYGDGSNLTGIAVDWNGGTVSNPTEFDNDVMLNTFVQINGVVNGDSNGIVTFDSGIEVINGYGVSASYFIGDGSGLTNLPTGTYSDTYTTMAGLSGSTIIFDRNDLPAAYSVDLSPILMTYSISSLYWNSLTSELTIQTLDGDTFSQTINEFDSINSLSSITANDFYGGTFHGTFAGTYSNDIYTMGATLSGTELIFDRTDGASYSVDLAPIAGGGATPSLIDVLKSGNTAGTYSISSIDGETKIYFPPAPYDPGLYIDSTDPGDYIAQLQIKKLNGIVAGHTDLNTGAGTSIDMSSQNGLITSASDGTYNTQLMQTGNAVAIYGDDPAFAGAQYLADYSASYTNRSLVDKEYVDGAVAGAGGTLEETLALGNSTGTHSIYIGSSASKVEGYNGVSQHWYSASNPIFGDYFQIENGTGTSASFIRIFDDASGAINLANNNAWDLTSNDAGRTNIYMGGNTQILSENRDFAGNTFHVKTNAAIAPNGSTTETRDMINDTSAMVSTYTDTAGTQTYTLLQSYHNSGLKAGQIYVYNDRVNLKAEDNGVSFTNIELNYTDITVSGTPSFGGMKYDRDYSANYTNRSLVDKEYVDSLVGASDTLSEVLSNGNETGVNDIILTNSPFTSTSDSIRALGNVLADSKFSFEDLGGGAWAPTMRVDDADTKNYITVAKTDTYIHSSQVGGLINRYSQVKLNNGSSANVEISSQNIANGEYSLIRTRVDGNIVLENHEGVRIEFYPQMLSTDPKNIIIAAPDEFILQGGDMKIIGATGGFAGIKYNADYSANFTSNSLVTKGWVESQITLGLTETVGFRTDTISVDADSGMFSGITSVVPVAGITGSVLVAEDRVLLESIDDYRSKIDMTSEQVVIIGGGDLDNSRYRSEAHQLGTKKVTYYDESIASLGYGSAEKLQTFESSEHFYFDASSTGSMDLFYDDFFAGAVMDYEYEFFIRSQSASGKLMTYKIKKNGYYDAGGAFYSILPTETQKGTDDGSNGSWDISIIPTMALGERYRFEWNFTDGYIYTISVLKRYKQKKF